MSNPNEEKPNAADRNHETTIIVNGRPKKWGDETISFEQLVQLAFPGEPPNPNRIFTITFKKGQHQGSLVAGQTTKVTPGEIFNVTPTTKS